MDFGIYHNLPYARFCADNNKHNHYTRPSCCGASNTGR